jgi:1,4-dihydroxy-6-naphthoate synthase
MKLTIGFSPCPNDTFIFDALLNGALDTDGLEFEPVLEDVETLNQWAIAGKLAITKVSYGVVPLILANYGMLNSGGAMGMGVGPLLITTPENSRLPIETLRKFPIAIPGENTTAHLLMSYAFPDWQQKKFMVFHEIEAAILSGRVAAGVIIHENRFTYSEKGLVLIKDLGKHWEDSLQCPIPLGGIAIQRKLPLHIQETVNRLIQQSIELGWQQYPLLSYYVKEHAQEMSEDVMRKHIQLYVNDFSLSAGPIGKKAVATLLEVYANIRGISMDAELPVFVLPD